MNNLCFIRKLCALKCDDLVSLIDSFKSELHGSPLFNLTCFLLKAIKLKSKMAFKKLMDNYEPCISRDPSLIPVKKEK